MTRFHLLPIICILCLQSCFYSTKTGTKYLTTVRAVPVHPPQVASLKEKGDISIANNFQIWDRTLGLSLSGNYAISDHFLIQASAMYYTVSDIEIEQTEINNDGGAFNLALGYYHVSAHGNLFETSIGLGYKLEKLNIERTIPSTGLPGQSPNLITTPYGVNSIQLYHKIFYGIGDGICQFGLGFQTNLLNHQKPSVAAYDYRIDSYTSLFGETHERYLEDVQLVKSQLLLQPFYNLRFRFTDRIHMVLQSSVDILTNTSYKTSKRINGGLTIVYYPVHQRSKDKEFDF